MKKENKTVAYIRVSDKNQNEIRQVNAIKEFDMNIKDIYIDKQSGKDFNREQYIIMKNILKENALMGGTNLLVIKSIDRLGRDYKMILEEWQEITKNIGADIVVLDMPLLDTRQNKDLLGTFISDLVLQILSYVSEQERTYIKQRQAEGILAAKTSGKVKFGRPVLKKSDLIEDAQFMKRYFQYKVEKSINLTEMSKLLGCCRNSCYNKIRILEQS